MDRLRVWMVVDGEQYYHAVENFHHAVKVVAHLSEKWGSGNVGLEQGLDDWWFEWEDDYGLNIHAQNHELYA